jgi:hypothetical protein
LKNLVSNALFLFLFLVSSLKGQEVRVHSKLEMEIWPTAIDSIQHRMSMEGDIAFLFYDYVKAAGGIQLLWWGQHYSLIPGSFLNAEAGMWLERNYYAGIAGKISMCEIGPYYDRRSVAPIGQEAVWHRTLGYVDQLRIWATCGGNTWAIKYMSPSIARFNDITLPNTDHLLTALLYVDKVKIRINGEYGGQRKPAANGTASYDFGNIELGISAGVITRPDWVIEPLTFVAAKLIIEFGKTSLMHK